MSFQIEVFRKLVFSAPINEATNKWGVYAIPRLWREPKPICDTMLAVSHDGGYTWEKPVPVADSSVTPHIVALDNGILILIYGRPGVHFKISRDNGKSWSESHSIIGATLEEERKNKKSDAQSKCFDTSSYSNTFAEKISGDTVAVVYNDMKYVDTDDEKHKAGFLGRITVKTNPDEE